MRSLVIFLIVFTTYKYSYSQVEFERQSNINLVRSFYYQILDREFSSVLDYYEIFGQHSEDEYGMFLQDCKLSETICSDKWNEVNARPSSYGSSVMSRFRKNRTMFSFNYSKTEIEYFLNNALIIDNLLPDGLDIQIKFPNNQKLTFVVSKFHDEPKHIIDIYFNNGTSAFSLLGIRSENPFYMRLAKIIDENYSQVRAGPTDDSEYLFKLRNDDLFFIYIDYSNKYWKIITKDCKIGFIDRNSAKTLGYLISDEKNSLIDVIEDFYLNFYCQN